MHQREEINGGKHGEKVVYFLSGFLFLFSWQDRKKDVLDARANNGRRLREMVSVFDLSSTEPSSKGWCMRVDERRGY